MRAAGSRGSRGSLGDSWGDAEYQSDEAASLESASDLDSEDESENGLEDKTDYAKKEYMNELSDMATPLPSRTTRGSSRTPQSTPIKTPANRVAPRNSHSPRSNPRSQSRSTQPTPESNLEPSLIMPSMYGPSDFTNGSPLRNSQLRTRKARVSSNHGQASSAHSSPRNPGRRVSAQIHPSQDQPQYHSNPDRGLWHHLNVFQTSVLWPILQYILAVAGMAFEYLKPLLAVMVAVCLVAITLNGASTFLHSSIQTALTPICSIPGTSYIVPFCTKVPTSDSSDGPDFDTLVGLQSAFEDIVKENEQSSTLPQTMKRGELAIRDIKTLVRFSKLPSKSELELEFDTFIAMAKEASSELIKYNSRIGGTVDKVINTNKWTIRILEGLRAQEASKGLISHVAASLNPLSAFQAPPLTLQQKIFDQYLQHIGTNKEDLEGVIQMGESLVFLLSSLEDKLETIYSIAIRDDLHISQNRDELLSQLWTKLGGNASTRKDYDRQLMLLKSVASYRKEAVLHVSATLLKLQEIAAGMEDLRDNVAAPEVLGFRDEMPVERYLELVRSSVDRLADVRGEQQRIEKDNYMRVMKDPNEIEGIQEVDGGPVVKAKNKAGMRR